MSHKRFIYSILLGLSAVFPMLGCSLGWEQSAIDVAKEISAYPDAKFLGDFITSYPSSSPSAGVVYRSDANRDALLEFYQDELIAGEWEIVKIDAENKFETVPYIISAKNDAWFCSVIIENMNQGRQITISLSPR